MRCLISGCEKERYCKGFCQMHYVRYRRHGDPTFIKRRTNADGKGYRQANGRTVHREIAEKALGKALPKGACVHHVNGDPSDNTPTNLVICPDNAYHMLLHVRERALDACGHAYFRKCQFCNKWDDLQKLVVRNKMVYHLSCQRQDNRARGRQRRENRNVPIQTRN